MKVGIILPHTQEEFGILTDEQYARHDGYEHKYAKLIAEKGHEPTVYFLSHRPGTAEFTHTYGHRVVRVPLTAGLGPGKQFSIPLLRAIGRDFKEKRIEMAHIFSYYCFQYDPFAIYCALKGIPFIAQYHGGEFNPRNPLHLLRALPLFLTLRLARRVLYVRPQEAKNLSMFGVRAQLLFNWVEPEVFRETNARRDRNAILFVGRMCEEKGVMELLRAFEKVSAKRPELKLTLAGRSGPEEEEALAYIKKRGLRADVKGYVPIDKLVELYNRSWLAVFPSQFEPFSLVALESISCGTPCIITESFGIAPALRECGYELIAPPNNIEALAAMMEKALSDDDFRKKSVEKGKIALEAFNKGKAAGELLEVYKKSIE